MTNLIPAAPGWYVAETSVVTENGERLQFRTRRPVIAWHVVDHESGALLPIVPNPRAGVVQATVRLDMGTADRRLFYHPNHDPATDD
jgi:hypothetical protein